jgi:hypothetical protein
MLAPYPQSGTRDNYGLTSVGGFAVNELILAHWGIPADLLPLFLDTMDGLALLALLCNAGAKDWPDCPGDPHLYALKAETVRWACLAA